MQPYPDTTAVPPPPLVLRRPRSSQFLVFVAALAWYLFARTLAASAARGITLRFDLADVEPLLEALFLLFLVVLGFTLLRGIERRRAPLSTVLGLPRRPTARREWATGAALGWALALAAILPMALARTLNIHLWTAPRAFELLLLALATLAVAVLAHALVFFGYPFHRLIEAIGPVRATVLIMLFSGAYAAFSHPNFAAPLATRILVEMLVVLLLALCWLRTHGLWLLWGLHFGWAATTGVLFGLPLAGDTGYASVVETRALGHLWLTGGAFGPGAAFLSIFVALLAIPILFQLTSDYAWAYTHPPLIPAGYDVTIAPPAAHLAMEAAAPAPPASLVQILPAAAPPPPPIAD